MSDDGMSTILIFIIIMMNQSQLHTVIKKLIFLKPKEKRTLVAVMCFEKAFYLNIMASSFKNTENTSRKAVKFCCRSKQQSCRIVLKPTERGTFW